MKPLKKRVRKRTMLVEGGKTASSCRAAARAGSLENHSAYGSLKRGRDCPDSIDRMEAMTNAVAPISLMSLMV